MRRVGSKDPEVMWAWTTQNLKIVDVQVHQQYTQRIPYRVQRTVLHAYSMVFTGGRSLLFYLYLNTAKKQVRAINLSNYSVYQCRFLGTNAPYIFTI